MQNSHGLSENSEVLGQTSQGHSENDRLLAQKSKCQRSLGQSENDELLAKKSQGLGTRLRATGVKFVRSQQK